MITALAEFIDMLYTRCVTEMPKDVCWRITIRQADPELPAAGPLVQLHAHWENSEIRVGVGSASPETYQSMIVGDFKTIDVRFSAVEEGARVGTEELATVADYYINKMKKELA